MNFERSVKKVSNLQKHFFAGAPAERKKYFVANFPGNWPATEKSLGTKVVEDTSKSAHLRAFDQRTQARILKRKMLKKTVL